MSEAGGHAIQQEKYHINHICIVAPGWWSSKRYLLSLVPQLNALDDPERGQPCTVCGEQCPGFVLHKWRYSVQSLVPAKSQPSSILLLCLAGTFNHGSGTFLFIGVLCFLNRLFIHVAGCLLDQFKWNTLLRNAIAELLQWCKVDTYCFQGQSLNLAPHSSVCHNILLHDCLHVCEDRI